MVTFAEAAADPVQRQGYLDGLLNDHMRTYIRRIEYRSRNTTRGTIPEKVMMSTRQSLFTNLGFRHCKSTLTVYPYFFERSYEDHLLSTLLHEVKHAEDMSKYPWLDPLSICRGMRELFGTTRQLEAVRREQLRVRSLLERRALHTEHLAGKDGVYHLFGRDIDNLDRLRKRMKEYSKEAKDQTHSLGYFALEFIGVKVKL